MLVLLIGLVPLRNPGIQIPAVIVETRQPGESLNLCAGFLFQMGEADHDIGDLHTGVVDIVLNIDFPARMPQQADEGVAENGVAQMSDVRGFVRINAGVFNQDLPRRSIRRGLLVGGEGSGHPGAVDPDVEISRRSNVHGGDTFDRTDLGPNRFGDL